MAAHAVFIHVFEGNARGDDALLVLADGFKLGGFGLAFGLIGAVAGTRLLSSQLYGAPALQPMVFGAALGACSLALLFASWLPALRATAVDPVEALRSE